MELVEAKEIVSKKISAIEDEINTLIEKIK